jgi:hypothetical protein
MFSFSMIPESSEIFGEMTIGKPIAQYSPSFMDVQYFLVGTGFTGFIAKSPNDK